MQYTTLRGFSLSSIELGDPQGFPLLVLHDHRSSKSIAGLFDGMTKASGFRLIAVDRPGYGQTTAPVGYRLEHFVFALSSWLIDRGITSYAVVGIGSGASTAVELARLASQRVKSLHLFNPVMQGTGLETAEGWVEALPVAFSSLPKALKLSRMEVWLESKLVGHHAEKALQQLAKRSGRADREALQNPVVRRVVSQSLLEAFQQSAEHILIEHRQAVTYRLPGSLAVPVRVYLSAVAQQESVRKLLPSAQIVSFEGQGPLSVLIEAVEQLEEDLALTTGLKVVDPI